MLLMHQNWLWPKPVVYALFNKGSLIWVGQSVNLANRIYGHAKDGRKFDTVWYQEVPKHKLNQVEAYLIKQAKPSDNVKEGP